MRWWKQAKVPKCPDWAFWLEAYLWMLFVVCMLYVLACFADGLASLPQ